MRLKCRRRFRVEVFGDTMVSCAGWLRNNAAGRVVIAVVWIGEHQR
jgi:hypothetical protein